MKTPTPTPTLRRLITGATIAVAMAFSSTVFSTAHAATYQVILSNVWAYNDADYPPDREGDVRLNIEIDGEVMYTNMRHRNHIKLDDNDNNKFYFKDKQFFKANKKSKMVEGDFTLEITAFEYDNNSGNEKCEAFKFHNSTSTGRTKLKCAGSLGLWLTYYVKRLD